MNGRCHADRMRTREELMRRMMGRLNVDPALAMAVDGGLAWYEAQTKCVLCPSAQECRDWLEATRRLPGSNRFCPNADFFKTCVIEVVGRGTVPGG